MCAGRAYIIINFNHFSQTMKLNGLTGKGTGKLGSSIFAINSGEQIVRQYQPNVANPSTEGQVEQRSKLKLMSQIAAAYALVLAFRKDGMKSARNLFISKNIVNVSFNEDTASVNLPAMQLTAGSAAIPAISVSRNGTTALNVALAADASKICARVVYVAMIKTVEGSVQYLDSAVVETAGADGTFPGTLAYTAAEVVVYAYGIKDMSANASSIFGNYSVTNGTQVASLIANRSMSASDFGFTKTVGVQLAAQA